MNTIRWFFLPYCLERLANGRYIVLNRNYKPLGIQSRDWVDYETHPSAATMKITAATAKKLSWDDNENLEHIYFYNDGCVPTDGREYMDAYLKRLAVLMKIKVVTP